LSLSNQIISQHCRPDSYSRRLLETERVNTTEKLFGQVHSIKSFDSLIPVGIKVGIGQSASSFPEAALFPCWMFTRGWIAVNTKQQKRNKNKDLLASSLSVATSDPSSTYLDGGKLVRRLPLHPDSKPSTTFAGPGSNRSLPSIITGSFSL
jgi:hypothetical protein